VVYTFNTPSIAWGLLSLCCEKQTKISTLLLHEVLDKVTI